MSDNGNNTQFIGLAEAARRLGATGRAGVGIHPATLSRWITKGVATAGGGKVRLEARRFGSKWATTAAWLDAFVATTTAGAIPAEAAPTLRSPAERQRAVAAADAQLAEMGV